MPMPKLSQRLKDERQYVESVLGNAVICAACSATLGTYADKCMADLSTICDGFAKIESAKTEFNQKRKEAPDA